MLNLRTLTLLALFVAVMAGCRKEEPTSEFARDVNLDRIATIAVQRDGRLKTLDSHAREMMNFVMGPRSYEGQSSLFSYLDLLFRSDAYENADVIYVKSKLMRTEISKTLRRSLEEQFEALREDPRMAEQFGEREAEVRKELEDRLYAFENRGLIAEPMLMDPGVREILGRMERDVLRTAKFVRAIDTAMTVRSPQVLSNTLRTIPPPGDNLEDPWASFDQIVGMAQSGQAGGHDPAKQGELATAWLDFATAWRAQNAAEASAAADRVASLVTTLNPTVYPEMGRLNWERWYFSMGSMTWVWIIYALALIPLVLHVVFRWEGARWLGFAGFLAAFLLHTFAVGLRWYVAERWPNSNMFEAITTAAWFGGCFAVILEIALNRFPVRGMIALGSAVASMVALMAVDFLPLQLNPAIGNMMPVLHDVWLYVHTNVIIFSYCLIFMASISAGLYLARRVIARLRGVPKSDRLSDFARVGGAGSLIQTRPDGTAYLTKERATLGQVLDGTTMILLELSFILLWAGLVMGAIWADHSWGRPWGWDPKEVFALNTFIIFALLIHTRFKVKDKGLWTAALAVVGCAVMIFNWVVINFTISGLHSYA